jgi:hypothetical protein
MNKFKVRVEHRDSWSAEDNYTEYKFFETEEKALYFVNLKMSNRTGRAPEQYENAYYEGVGK